MKKSKSARNIRVIGLIFVVFMTINIGLEIYNTVKTKYDISVAQTQNEELKKEAEKLSNEVSKLKDDSYIQSYVSGTIFSTEKGTTIYVLPKDKAPE